MVDEEILALLVNYANAQEAAAVDLKRKVAEVLGIKEVAAVKEETFSVLKWERQKGSKIGEFEVAYKPHNIPEKWSHAYGILNKNNATIASRYHGESYAYAYWLYGKDRIYKQKRK